MKVKVYFEKCDNTNEEKFRRVELGGDYPSKFYPCPLWNSNLIVEEIKRSRLTEDEVEDRVREIQSTKEVGKPLTIEMDDKVGIVYTVGDYECPHCKKHYVIKCDGKRDWVE